MRTITLEEHFASPAFLAGPGKEFNEALRNRGPRGVKISEQLRWRPAHSGNGSRADRHAGAIPQLSGSGASGSR